jgi:glycosyltransferase involved in cell wall biosynthesis
VTRPAGPVVFDLQATQSLDQRHRGIPRYVLELALALEETAPGAVDAYLLNPDRALPEAAERLAATGKVCFPDEVDWEAAGLFHIASPLEMTLRPHRQVPPAARRAGVPRVITLYDLIPYLFPHFYLEDPGLRRRYRARLQHVRTATAVLTLSEATRGDAVTHLGLDPGRVFVVGSGTGPQFVPPASRAEAAVAAAAAVPGLQPPFVFYIGSYEQRKNLEPLLQAWSLLPAAVRANWQLAVCCPLQPLELRHLQYRAGQMGIGGAEVCFTGFVPDEVLLLLHQGTDLFVFPSLYEGYGLPVAEALACGAAVLAADSSSLPEIVGREALFDASDPVAMAGAIGRGLTDEGLRGRLLAGAGRPPSTWAEVAAATVAVYDRVLSGEPRASPATRPVGAAGGRRRVALVVPWPPDGGRWGEWGYRLAEELTDRPGVGGCPPELEVSVFADRPVGADRRARPLEGPPGVVVHPLAALPAVEALEGAFDAVVYGLADDEHHTGVLATLRQRGMDGGRGVVVAHDVRLADLYGDAARHGGLPEGLEDLIRSTYGDGVEAGVGEGNVLPAAEARRRGILMARDVLARSARVFFTSERDAALARLDAAPRDRTKADVVDGEPAGVADALYSELTGRRLPRRAEAAPRRPGTARKPDAGPVVFDLQATQTVDQRHRGISRYALELARAVHEAAPAWIGAFVINPDLPLPEDAEGLVTTGKLLHSREVDWNDVGLLHVVSLFEMSVPLHRLLPPAALAAGVPWVLTLHDLIPHLMPEAYLEDPGRRRRYRARLQLVRSAAAVLTNSAGTRTDAVEHLGLDPGRVFVAGTGTGPQFVPPASRGEAAAAAAAALPGLRTPFVFYVGNYEKRKNLEALLEAWSLLDPDLRRRYTLVVCALPNPLERNHMEFRAARMGMSGEVLFTGFVPDEVLLLLHQGTDLFVFPSLYEGYGLPVAEALACGAAVLAADSSSLPEIVGPEALFDASDPVAMAGAIERGLTDEGLRGRLLAAAGRSPSTWAEVAATTAAVYDRVLSGEVSAPGGRVAVGRPAGNRLRVALLTPWPPDGGRWGGWSYQLAEALSDRVEVSVFADRPVGAGRRVRALGGPPGVAVHPLVALPAVEGLAGAFDAVVYALADDEHHTGALATLRHRGSGGGRSVVVAHDVRLSDLYGCAAREGGLPEGLEELIGAVYGDGVETGLGKGNLLSAAEARRRGILLTRDAVAHSGRYLLTSDVDALVARLDAAPEDRPKITVVPADPAGLAGALYSVLAGP